MTIGQTAKHLVAHETFEKHTQQAARQDSRQGMDTLCRSTRQAAGGRYTRGGTAITIIITDHTLGARERDAKRHDATNRPHCRAATNAVMFQVLDSCVRFLPVFVSVSFRFCPLMATTLAEHLLTLIAITLFRLARPLHALPLTMTET